MPRSARVCNLFRYCASFVTVLGGMLAFMSFYYQVSKMSINKAFIILCTAPLTAIILDRGSVSIMYIRLLQWVLQHLHTTEDHRWVIGLGITALCDFVLVALKTTPFIVLSTLAMIMICVVAAGWDSDRSGMTEGLLIGFFKLLLFSIFGLQLLASILCGTVIVLAIASKLTECAVRTEAGNTIHVTSADSTHHITEV